MDYKAEYARWCAKVTDPELSAQLSAIEKEDAEIQARFSAELEFGTAGLRGILGAGISRMNLYTVRRATQGLASYIVARYGEGSVAIAYDSRNKSTLFAREAASVLAANGVKAWLFDRLMPTPMLSFAVRELSASAGIVITASHNPAQYNGYKVYGPDGCQMTLEDTRSVSDRIAAVDLFDDVRTADFDTALAERGIQYIPARVVERYYEEVENQRIIPDICRKYPVSAVFTPLNGTGNEPVRRVLDDCGVTVSVVPEQENPDGNFPTCSYPNPETKEALKLGLALCAELEPDLLIATDPDADRVGVAVRDGGEYRILTGNEVGILLLHYIIEARNQNNKMPENPVAVRSIVSSAMTDEIAKAGGVEMRSVLTGFKFIGEQILLLEQRGEAARFIFGFEESCGYLAGSYVRDKDAVLACMLLCEMTAWCKQQGTTPFATLMRLYDKFGYYRHEVVNIAFEGLTGAADMEAVMNRLYEAPPETVAGFGVVTILDYWNSVRISRTMNIRTPIDLPAADVIGLLLENGAQILVRPSGTEPKMKLYLTACEKTAEQSIQLIHQLEQAAKKLAER